MPLIYWYKTNTKT